MSEYQIGKDVADIMARLTALEQRPCAEHVPANTCCSSKYSLTSLQSEQVAYIDALDRDDLKMMVRMLWDSQHDVPGTQTENPVFDLRGLTPDWENAALDAPRVIIQQWTTSRKSNYRSNCGCDQTSTCSTENHGQSYMTTDYNLNPAPYEIKILIRHYGREYYGASSNPWRLFVEPPAAYRLWSSAWFTGQGAPGRAGYFYSGNNQTPGRHTGTFGVAVRNRGSADDNPMNAIWGGLWYLENSTWGDQWLRCGHDYGFWLAH